MRIRNSVIAAFLFLLAVGGPTVSAAAHATTGDRISLFQGDGTYPSSTAFYLRHGWELDPDAPGAGLYQFRLDLDGSPRLPSFQMSTSYPDGSLEARVWFFNFPHGLTGTHTFTGHWLVPCGSDAGTPCGGLPRNTLVEGLTVSAEITFGP